MVVEGCGHQMEDELKVVGGKEKLCGEVEMVAQIDQEGGHGGLDCQTWQLWGKVGDPPTGEGGGGSDAVDNS